MDLLQLIILAIVQGLTEFLPVSSSGHLVILGYLFGLKESSLFINVILHGGTFLAVVIFFFKEIIQLFRPFSYKKNPQLFYIIFASIPTAIIALGIKQVYNNLGILLIGIFFIITATLLWISKRFQAGNEENTLKKSLIIGIVQGIAALPGISRSGSTIITGLFLKLERTKAFEFSFLLSLPAVLGANVMEFRDYLKAPVSVGSIPLSWVIIGAIISGIVGFFSILLLKKIMQQAKFHYFAYYCLLAGIVAIVGGLVK